MSKNTKEQTIKALIKPFMIYSLSLFLLCNTVCGMVIPTVEVQHVADDIVKLMKHPSRVVTTEGPLTLGVPAGTIENAVKQRDPIINVVKEGVKKKKAPKRKLELKVVEPKVELSVIEPNHQPLIKQESLTSHSASKVPSTQEEDDEFF